MTGPNPAFKALTAVAAALALPILAFLSLASAGTDAEQARIGGGPSHPHGALRAECAQCHTAEQWSPARIGPAFTHDPDFPLKGAHAATACRACHRSLVFSDAPSACVSCHDDIHLGELGTDCARCHSTSSFIDRGEMMRRHIETGFSLDGAHATAACEDCHEPAAQGQSTYAIDSACESCHMDEYRNTVEPDHEAGGFPHRCEDCHTPMDWNAGRFDHALTGFALEGTHAALACAECHGDRPFGETQAACVSCHQQDYDGTTDPSHAAAAFPTDCALCHGTRDWLGASFDHAGTAFPLSGAHTNSACLDCHSNGIYAGLPSACASCHQQDYDGTTDPSHALAGFPTDCVSCHTTIAWTPAAFDHDTAYFPIHSGRHREEWSSCADCHVTPTSFADFSCIVCHEHADQPQVDNDHSEVPDYIYTPRSCFDCHPSGQN
jgi:hypothetical protein